MQSHLLYIIYIVYIRTNVLIYPIHIIYNFLFERESGFWCCWDALVGLAMGLEVSKSHVFLVSVEQVHKHLYLLSLFSNHVTLLGNQLVFFRKQLRQCLYLLP